MKILARFLLTSLILVFAVGSVVHGVEASGMNAKMSSLSGGIAPGCDDCGGGDGENGKAEKACPSLCVTPANAVLPTVMPITIRVSETLGFHAAGLMTGQSGPPDPYPPRPTLN